MYRLFDHTADVGFHIEAESLESLFADAGRALMSLLIDDTDEFEPRERVEFELEAERLDDLLFDYLAELLYRFSVDRFVPVKSTINTNSEHLSAELSGDRFDPDYHRGGIEVKAITYHGLVVEKRKSSYVAEVIVDV